MELRDLYQSIIVDNALHPQNQKPLNSKRAIQVKLFNPTCGDVIRLSGIIEAQHLKQIAFKATGCIISRASANMMSNLCLNKSTSQIINFVTDFSKLMTNEPVQDLKKLGEAQALKSISELPTRIKCAMLPWKAIYQLIQHNQGRSDHV